MVLSSSERREAIRRGLVKPETSAERAIASAAQRARTAARQNSVVVVSPGSNSSYSKGSSAKGRGSSYFNPGNKPLIPLNNYREKDIILHIKDKAARLSKAQQARADNVIRMAQEQGRNLTIRDLNIIAGGGASGYKAAGKAIQNYLGDKQLLATPIAQKLLSDQAKLRAKDKNIRRLAAEAYTGRKTGVSQINLKDIPTEKKTFISRVWRFGEDLLSKAAALEISSTTGLGLKKDPNLNLITPKQLKELVVEKSKTTKKNLLSKKLFTEKQKKQARAMALSVAGTVLNFIPKTIEFYKKGSVDVSNFFQDIKNPEKIIKFREDFLSTKKQIKKGVDLGLLKNFKYQDVSKEVLSDVKKSKVVKGLKFNIKNLPLTTFSAIATEAAIITGIGYTIKKRVNYKQNVKPVKDSTRVLSVKTKTFKNGNQRIIQKGNYLNQKGKRVSFTKTFRFDKKGEGSFRTVLDVPGRLKKIVSKGSLRINSRGVFIDPKKGQTVTNIISKDKKSLFKVKEFIVSQKGSIGKVERIGNVLKGKAFNFYTYSVKKGFKVVSGKGARVSNVLVKPKSPPVVKTGNKLFGNRRLVRFPNTGKSSSLELVQRQRVFDSKINFFKKDFGQLTFKEFKTSKLSKSKIASLSSRRSDGLINDFNFGTEYKPQFDNNFKNINKIVSSSKKVLNLGKEISGVIKNLPLNLNIPNKNIVPFIPVPNLGGLLSKKVKILNLGFYKFNKVSNKLKLEVGVPPLNIKRTDFGDFSKVKYNLQLKTQPSPLTVKLTDGKSSLKVVQLFGSKPAVSSDPGLKPKTLSVAENLVNVGTAVDVKPLFVPRLVRGFGGLPTLPFIPLPEIPFGGLPPFFIFPKIKSTNKKFKIIKIPKSLNKVKYTPTIRRPKKKRFDLKYFTGAELR